MMFIISDCIDRDSGKAVIKNIKGQVCEIYSCYERDIIKKFISRKPSAVVISDFFLLRDSNAYEILFHAKKNNRLLFIVSDLSTFREEYIPVDYKIIVIGNNTLSELLKDKVSNFLVKQEFKNKILSYSRTESEVIKCLCEGKSVKDICNQHSFMEKTLSTHIGNIKKKSGLRSKQQLFYLYIIQKKINDFLQKS
ncbi:helix-turn-helix transcriptional regulator [Enterobacter sp. Ap-916]|uniref:LuxR C-terminal-related transcriptional regulator n=1 Tax=Enterobacteriaceae TaxID=543 RepID=UPI000272A04D|nr:MULTISPECIES: LuxR C-terminal-related transcriptional regulator [unclassified Enterobacter]EJF30555.1 colanic acid capsular biosynthesis activation protein A [Enterobacter sp. Ag1]NIF61091.1 helix-turn-helix transcriptional regulator [Enterobacter sp. Ap-867]NIG32231.1 helix-turn-helix transcriptional regulator [Enterobacter sp. Ap-916]